MNKVEIKARLEESYQSFTNYTQQLSKDEYEYAPEGKWNAGEQTLHLIKSIKPVTMGLSMPKFLIKWKFGKANRPSRTYEELVERYKKGLADNPGIAPKDYAPGKVTHSQANDLDKKLLGYVEIVNSKLSKWSEDELDQFIAPHPLIGKITFREVLYFTIYHAQHHQLQIKRYLKGV